MIPNEPTIATAGRDFPIPLPGDFPVPLQAACGEYVPLWSQTMRVGAIRLLVAVATILSPLPGLSQTAPDLSGINPGSYDATWWNRTPQRFMQTNLREIDARDFNVERYVQSVLDASVTTVLLSVGGQVANYPTQLPFHYRNPYMKGDLVGDVVQKLHTHGVRVMARFDFARIHESIALNHPDWLYVSPKGGFVHDNGHYLTCINGDYQQRHGFEILKEALSAYAFDAVYFNAAGYTRTDYSQNYHGICQCKNCSKRFREFTGLELPKAEDDKDPVFRAYDAFRKTTHSELNSRITRTIKSVDSNLVLTVYNSDGGIWRSESGTGYTSSDYWTYHATENVKRVLGSHKERAPFDTYNYLMGMDYRHTATSPNIGRIFMPQQMLNGGALGIYFIGHLDNQYDREFIPKFIELAAFHKRNEKLFTNVEARSKIGLVIGSPQETKGLMKMLIEEHLMFDLIFPSALAEKSTPKAIHDYELLILGDIANMADAFISLIDDYVKGGGKILATGFPGINDQLGNPLNRIRMESLGVASEYELFTNPKPSYLDVSAGDKAILGGNAFRNFDLVMMNSSFLKTKPGAKSRSITRLIPKIMHGPPEKCYFTDDQITDYPGVVHSRFGDGQAVLIPWQIGAQYEWKGNNAHLALFVAALDNLLAVKRTLVTDTSPLVEMTHLVNRNGAFEWIGMINHTGQIGNSFREPVPVFNSAIRFKPQKPAKEIYAMKAGERLKFRQSADGVEVVVPRLDEFEMLVVFYESPDFPLARRSRPSGQTSNE